MWDFQRKVLICRDTSYHSHFFRSGPLSEGGGQGHHLILDDCVYLICYIDFYVPGEAGQGFKIAMKILDAGTNIFLPKA